MDEQHIETIEKLKEIRIRDDYFGLIDAVFLEEIAQLPILNRNQQNVFYDEVNNLNDGMSFFQDLTNELIRQIIERYG